MDVPKRNGLFLLDSFCTVLPTNKPTFKFTVTTIHSDVKVHSFEEKILNVNLVVPNIYADTILLKLRKKKLVSL